MILAILDSSLTLILVSELANLFCYYYYLIIGNIKCDELCVDVAGYETCKYPYAAATGAGLRARSPKTGGLIKSATTKDKGSYAFIFYLQLLISLYFF